MLNKTVSDIQILEDNHAEVVSSIMMVIILVSFSMLFATLFLAYAIFRMGNPVWPPMGMQKVNLLIPSLSSFVALISSILFHLFFRDLKKDNFKLAKKWLTMTLITGIGFLIVQAQLWHSLKLSGMFASSGIFGSMNYAFTWIHAAHILMGIFLLAWLRLSYHTNQVMPHKYLLAAKNVGKFWHFLTLMWFMIYIFIFVV